MTLTLYLEDCFGPWRAGRHRLSRRIHDQGKHARIQRVGEDDIDAFLSVIINVLIHALASTSYLE